MFSIEFSYSRHEGMSKTDECNLCRNTIDLSKLRVSRVLSRFKIEINGTTMHVFEKLHSCFGPELDRFKHIDFNNDACPVDLRSWENGGF